MYKKLIILIKSSDFRTDYTTNDDDVKDITCDVGCNSAIVGWTDGTKSLFSGVPFYYYTNKP